MRVAIVSDTHGNKPAMDAVLAVLDERGPYNAIVGGGDFCFGGLYPVECIQEVRNRGWDAVRGNTEEAIVAGSGDGVIPGHDRQEEIRIQGENLERAIWFAEQLSEHIDYLQSLPLSWETTGPSGQKLIFVHATPWNAHDILYPDADEAELAAVLNDAGADALLYGHIHYAYQRRVRGKLIGCVGSAGIPLDKDIRPCFAIAEDDGIGWSVSHVRTGYDRDGYIAALQAAAFPGASGMATMVLNAEPVV